MKMILCMILSIAIKNVLCSANLRNSIYNLNTNHRHLSTATGVIYQVLVKGKFMTQINAICHKFFITFKL